VPEPAGAVAAAARSIEALSRPFRVEEGAVVAVGASAGVALCPAHGGDADALMTNADLALRRAKAESRGRPFLFDPAIGEVASARRALCDELRRAAAEAEFRLRYQPQVCLATGRVVGVEALLRWQHPSRGLLAPAEFIDLIEPAGVAVQVGAWVLRKTCAQARRWREAGLPDLRVGINLSAAQFRDPGLTGLVLDAIAEHGIAPPLLELEITEGTYLGQGEAVAGPLRRLRESGVRVSFDDFGTGYASLSYLKRFPLDRLKIDRSFTRGIASDYGDAAIVRAIIGLARNLDLAVIAEGVETAEQELFLRRHGCHEAQGYRYGRPLEAGVVPAVVLDRLSGFPPAAASDPPPSPPAPPPPDRPSATRRRQPSTPPSRQPESGRFPRT
jgi:EAL domain-containing protein (putative c-di-GMP-specific phosphodiesterase class I)